MDRTTTARIAGLVGGCAAVALALTPSLVPRPALFQGFLAGLCFALAYLGAAWLWHAGAALLARRRAGGRAKPSVAGPQAPHGPADPAAPAPSHSLSHAPSHSLSLSPRPASKPGPAASSGRTARVWPVWVWAAAGAAGGIYVALLGIAAVEWQNDVRNKVDMAPVDGLDLLTFVLVAAAAAGIVFGARWGLRKMSSLGRGWARRAGGQDRVAAAAGIFTGALSAALALALLVSGALVGTDRVYSARNDSTPAGITEPASEFRSAGPGSDVEWGKLGMQGRAFVGGGPAAADIEKVTGRPAKDPVRVYVGLQQEQSMDARAALAVAELKRTGAFNRGTLMIATPTGSGWLERQAVDSLEYLQGGDSAIVSMQYSYQPSWVSFLFHQDLPRDSAQALYKAVRSEWDTMPAAKRPTLLVYGLSLGASGMQSAFTGIDDLTGSIDGAVFSGAPNNSQPWGELQARRDPGSPPWQPVFDGGRNVRWLSNNGDFETFHGPWESARVAYLQHGTDAVTWLTPRLIWQKPDWLAGSAAAGGRAPDVSDAMRWIPLVTYLQVAFDMFMGEAVPASHGHNFGDVAVGAWNGVAPSGLDPAAVERIQAVIAAYPYEESMTN